MAEASVFDRGLQQGYARGEEPRLRSQAREDQEFQLKISDLVDQRKTLQQKLPTLTGEDGKATPEYDKAMNDLQENAKAIREMYHPDKNPGAIAKFGHYLMDAVHSRTPQERVERRDQRTGEKILKNEAADKDAAQKIALSAPPSPVQEAANEARVQQAKIDEVIKNWDRLNPDHSPEERQQFIHNLTDSTFLGYKKTPQSDRGNWEMVQGTKDGKPFAYYHDKYSNKNASVDGSDLDAGDLQGFVPAEKKGAAGKPIRGWSKDKTGRIYSVDLDPKTNQSIPGTENYSVIPPAYMVTRLSTGVYHWVDENNQIHETPETRTSSPQIPGGAAPSGGGGASPASGQSAQPGSIRTSYKDKILGYKGSGVINHAEQAYSDAVKIASAADRLSIRAKNTPDQMAEADTAFVLQLIHSQAGRVNQQEIQQYFNAGGIYEAPERWAAKAGHGQLSPNLRQQLIDVAHDSVGAAKDAVDAVKHGGQAQPNTPNAPGQKPANATHKINWPKGTPDWYWADKDGNNLGKITNASPN